MTREDYKRELELEDREYGWISSSRNAVNEFSQRVIADHRSRMVKKQMRKEDAPDQIKSKWKKSSGLEGSMNALKSRKTKNRIKNGAIGAVGVGIVGGAAGAGIASLGNKKRNEEIDELESRKHQSDSDRIRIAKLKSKNKRRNLIGAAIGAGAGVAIGGAVGSRVISSKLKGEIKDHNNRAKRASDIYNQKYGGR